MRRHFLLAIAIGSMAFCETVNYVDNGDFTSYRTRTGLPTGWSYSGPSACEIGVDPSVRYGDSQSLRLARRYEDGADRAWHIIDREVTGLRGGVPYTMSVMVKSRGLSEDSLAYVSFSLYGKQARLAANDSTDKLVGTTEWKRLTVTLPSLAPGTSTVRARLCLYGFGEAWFTNVQIEEGTEPSAYTRSQGDVLDGESRRSYEASAAQWLERKGIRADVAPVRPRIGVLDLPLPGKHPSHSSPEALCSALRGKYDPIVLTGSELGNPLIFNTDLFAMLIVPTGAYFPISGHRNLFDFLGEGGLMLTCGGYAFDVPVVEFDGQWQSPQALGTEGFGEFVPVALPEPEQWRFGNYGSSVTEVKAVTGPDGSRGYEVSTPYMEMYNNALAAWSNEGLPEDWSAVKFTVRGGPNTRRAWFELTEADGSRWHKAIDLSEEWKTVILTSSQFDYWGDNPSVGRGGMNDRLKPENVASLSFGFSADIEKRMVGHSACLAGLSVAVDPSRSIREMDIPWINTRHAEIRDCMHPKAEQLCVFDPSFELRDVKTTRTSPEVEGFFPNVAIEGALTGVSAIAQLGLNGHGFSPNRIRWQPLLECKDAEGRHRGHAGAIVHNFDGTYAGSSWAIFGVDNKDLFGDSEFRRDLFLPVVDTLFRRMYLHSTTGEYSCYRVGESARLLCKVADYGGVARKAVVNLRLSDGDKTLKVFEKEVSTTGRGSIPVEWTWVVPADSPPYVELTTELSIEGKVVDRESNAIVIWSPDVISRGPKLGRRGTLLTIDGEARFWMGCQTFWGQNDSITGRSPVQFHRDFQMMREHGLRLTRCFLPFKTELQKRQSDAVVMLAQMHGIVLYHAPNWGNVPTLKQLEPQNAGMAELAERYRDVPGLCIDICNEPTMRMETAEFESELGYPIKTKGRWDDQAVYKTWKTASDCQRRWAKTNRQAAKNVRGDLLVSVGFMQGWAGGNRACDPQLASLDLDFTDRHYYGQPEKMPLELKDCDLRVLGKPLVLGECGAKNHPTFKSSDPWGHGDDDAKYDRRFRLLVSQAFGVGAAAMSSWHWRDPMEGIFPCGLVHATRATRPTAGLYKRMAQTFGRLKMVENPPDTVVLMGEYMRHAEQRSKMTNAADRASSALLWHGVNFSLLTDSMLGDLPKHVRLLVYPIPYVVDDATFGLLESYVSSGGTLWLTGGISHKPSGGIDAGRLERLCGVKAVSGKLCEPMETLESPVVKVGESSLKVSALVALAGAEAVVRGDDGNVLLTCFSLGQGKVYFSPVPLEMVPVSESLMRSLYGRVLASSGVMTTRRPVDPETLMTYRVPGEGCTGWVFWNGGDEAVTVERGGHKLTVGAQRVGYLQVTDAGTCEVSEEL